MKIKYTMPGAHHPTHLDVTTHTIAEFEILLKYLETYLGITEYEYIHCKKDNK